jgi:hypothetical protein
MKPLLNFLPLSNVVFDLLHANLRISERLFEMLLNKLKAQDDKVDNCTQRQDIFINYLIKLRIYNPLKQDKKKYELRSFTRNENLRILSTTPLVELFRDLSVPQIVNIEKTWRLFYEINIKIIENDPAWTTEVIKERTKDWLDLCTRPELYEKSFPTVYSHMLISHLHQLHQNHGSIYRFNCQQLEYKNRSNTKNFFRSTNMHTSFSETDDY